MLPEQDVTIQGSAKTVPAGSYYLTDAVAGLSLLAKVQAAMVAAGVAGASAVMLVNRKVRLSAAGVFSVTWTDPLLASLLGYSANLVGLSSYVAPSISPLFWSPGTPGKSAFRKGLIGMPEALVYQSVSPYSGRTEHVSHGTRVYNRFTWSYIDADRIVTAGALGGEFATWHANVVVPAGRCKIYHDVQEDPNAVTVATMSTPLGPYIYSADRKGVSWVYDRSKGFDWTDVACDIDMSVHVCPEYNY